MLKDLNHYKKLYEEALNSPDINDRYFKMDNLLERLANDIMDYILLKREHKEHPISHDLKDYVELRQKVFQGIIRKW